MGKRNFLIDQTGQSFVEYILLLAVVGTLAVGILKNPKFKSLLDGTKGPIDQYQKQMEYSYRFGRLGIDPIDSFPYSSKTNPSYYNSELNKSRFYSPIDKYP